MEVEIHDHSKSAKNSHVNTIIQTIDLVASKIKRNKGCLDKLSFTSTSERILLERNKQSLAKYKEVHNARLAQIQSLQQAYYRCEDPSRILGNLLEKYEYLAKTQVDLERISEEISEKIILAEKYLEEKKGFYVCLVKDEDEANCELSIIQRKINENLIEMNTLKRLDSVNQHSLIHEKYKVLQRSKPNLVIKSPDVPQVISGFWHWASVVLILAFIIAIIKLYNRRFIF